MSFTLMVQLYWKGSRLGWIKTREGWYGLTNRWNFWWVQCFIYSGRFSIDPECHLNTRSTQNTSSKTLLTSFCFRVSLRSPTVVLLMGETRYWILPLRSRLYLRPRFREPWPGHVPVLPYTVDFRLLVLRLCLRERGLFKTKVKTDTRLGWRISVFSHYSISRYLILLFRSGTLRLHLLT